MLCILRAAIDTFLMLFIQITYVHVSNGKNFKEDVLFDENIIKNEEDASFIKSP